MAAFAGLLPYASQLRMGCRNTRTSPWAAMRLTLQLDDTPNGRKLMSQLLRIEQYVQIRGEDRRNPVILWLHGGQCTVPDYSSRSGDGALSAPTAECTRGLYARQ